MSLGGVCVAYVPLFDAFRRLLSYLCYGDADRGCLFVCCANYGIFLSCTKNVFFYFRAVGSGGEDGNGSW